MVYGTAHLRPLEETLVVVVVVLLVVVVVVMQAVVVLIVVVAMVVKLYWRKYTKLRTALYRLIKMLKYHIVL